MRHTDKTICLYRYYVKKWHGKGIATPLLEQIEQLAREAGADYVWLSMWAPTNAQGLLPQSRLRRSGLHGISLRDQKVEQVGVVEALVMGVWLCIQREQCKEEMPV